MIRDRSNSRPSGPATAAVLLATALLVTGGAGGAVLAGCTSDSDRPPVTSSSTSAPPWSVATPGGGTGTPGGGTGGTAAASGTGDGGQPSGPTGAGGTTRRPGGPAAQPSAEASRDGVEPSVAALPPSSRVRPVPRGPVGSTKVTADDGIWVVSRPEGARADYAEVLHLDRSGERILRAYPFPRLAPQWLLVTRQAVYCGRSGDGAAPDTMICRIDRVTGDLRVRVAADLEDTSSVTEADVAGRPGNWVVDDRNFVADFGNLPQVGSELTFRSGDARLRLSPDTLGVLGS